MKALISGIFLSAAMSAFGQGHDLKPADALKNVDFLKGEWTGKAEFITGGPPLLADVVTRFHDAIGGRYIEESLSTTVQGRKPSDTRHFLTYDTKAALYRAWWFNDSSVGAMELEGTLTGKKLVLQSKPTQAGSGPGNVFRATYESLSPTQLSYGLELKQGDTWQQLFHTTYTKRS